MEFCCWCLILAQTWVLQVTSWALKQWWSLALLVTGNLLRWHALWKTQVSHTHAHTHIQTEQLSSPPFPTHTPAQCNRVSFMSHTAPDCWVRGCETKPLLRQNHTHSHTCKSCETEDVILTCLEEKALDSALSQMLPGGTQGEWTDSHHVTDSHKDIYKMLVRLLECQILMFRDSFLTSKKEIDKEVKMVELLQFVKTLACNTFN